MNAEKLANIISDSLAGRLDLMMSNRNGDEVMVESPFEADDGAMEILVGFAGKSFLITVVDLDETEVQGS